MEVLVEVPSPPLAEDTESLPPLLLLLAVLPLPVLAALVAAPPALVALEVPTPSLSPDSSDSSAGSVPPQPIALLQSTKLTFARHAVARSDWVRRWQISLHRPRGPK